MLTIVEKHLEHFLTVDYQFIKIKAFKSLLNILYIGLRKTNNKIKLSISLSLEEKLYLKKSHEQILYLHIDIQNIGVTTILFYVTISFTI